MGGRFGFSMLMKKASLAGAFFVPAIWLSGAQAFCPAPSGLASVAVQRVVDGDTLRLADGRSVRMIGLNTPEAGQERPVRRTICRGGAKASRSLGGRERRTGRPACRQGRQGSLRPYPGPCLRCRWREPGERRLLAEGLGFQVGVAPNVDFVACQQAAERSARQASLGLWRQSPVLKARGAAQQSGFAVLSGRVSKIERNRGGIWIELEGSVVLRIAPDLARHIRCRLLNGLQGKQVEARGWVQDRSQARRPEAGAGALDVAVDRSSDD